MSAVEAVRQIIRVHRPAAQVDPDRGSLMHYHCKGCAYHYSRDLEAGDPGIDWMADHVAPLLSVAIRDAR